MVTQPPDKSQGALAGSLDSLVDVVGDLFHGLPGSVHLAFLASLAFALFLLVLQSVALADFPLHEQH